MILRALIFAVVVSLSFSARAVTVCFEAAEYTPWIIGNDTSPLANRHGALVDFVTYGARDSNIPIKFKRLPWKRCLDGVRKNVIDGAMVSVYVKDRESFLRFPGEPGKPDPSLGLWTVDYPVFTHMGKNWNFENGVFSRTNLIIGAPLGYAAHKILQGMSIHSVDDYDPHVGLRLVQKQRLDGYVVERRIGEAISAKHGLKDVRATKSAVFKANWYLVFSHAYHDNNPEQALQLWEASASVGRRQGASILQEYRQANNLASQEELAPRQ